MTREELAEVMHDTSKERMRSMAEVHARYVRALAQYKALGETQGDVRDQRLMMFHEVKVLGWVLGKQDKAVTADLNK